MAIEAGDAVWKIRGDFGKLKGDLAKASGLVGKATKGIIKNAKAIGIAFTIAGGAITAAFGVSVASAVEFTEVLGELNTLGVKDLDALEDAIKDVSMEFGTDLVDATKAAYQAISLGAKEAEVPKLLADAAKAATAGMVDLETAVTLGQGVMNAFGDSVKDVNQVFNEAFVAVKRGGINFEQLAAQVGKVAPIFAAVGLESKELFSAIAAITVAGIQGEQAFTGLKAAVGNIVKPSKEAADLAQALAFDFSSAALGAKGLEGFLSELKTTLDDNLPALQKQKLALESQRAALMAVVKPTKEQAAQLKAINKELKGLETVGVDTVSTMGKLFGSIEGLNVVLALMGEQSKVLTDSLAEMESGQNAVDAAFQRFLDANPAFAFQQLKATLRVLSVEIGQNLLPVLIDITRFITPVIQGVLKWIKENPGLTKTLTIVTAAVGALMFALGPLIFALPGIVIAVKLVSAAFIAMGIAGAGANVALLPIALTIGGIVLALGSLVLSLKAAGLAWDIFRAKANAAKDAAQTARNLERAAELGATPEAIAGAQPTDPNLVKEPALAALSAGARSLARQPSAGAGTTTSNVSISFAGAFSGATISNRLDLDNMIDRMGDELTARLRGAGMAPAFQEA